MREITLLGQNVNAYHGEGPDGRPWSLARLIDRLAAIDGLERLRYTTSHPRDMSDDLIAAHRDAAQADAVSAPAVPGRRRSHSRRHEPQAHARADYLAAGRPHPPARPDIALSTDIIVGFPGETEAEFEATLDVVREVGFAQAYSFKYSPRPGTPAANMEQVSEEVKVERLGRLQALLDQQQTSFNSGCVGKIMPVLFERTAAGPASSLAAHPICRRCMRKRRPSCWGASCRLKSRPPAPIVFLAS